MKVDTDHLQILVATVKEFNHHGDLASEICAPLNYDITDPKLGFPAKSLFHFWYP